jgi:hypothetical protein
MMMGHPMTKITLQQYADEALSPEYRQPLKTADDVADHHGWGDPASPQCCGAKVGIRTIIGDPYYAECGVCHKFAATADGPSFGNASVRFIDTDKVDIDTDRRWIVGIAPQHDRAVTLREKT